MDLLISIIVPIYNAEKYLTDCIHSILNQTYHSFELILIDDGSDDGSLMICRAFAEKDERITIVEQQNQGQGVARNKGLTLAKGEYVSFVDADDKLVEDGLNQLVHVLKKTSYDIVCGHYFSIRDDKKREVSTYKSGVVNLEGTKEEQVRYHKFKTTSCFGYVWGKLYKKSFLDRTNLTFDESRDVFMEDTLFNLKAMSYKPSYYLLNQAVYCYFIRDASTSNKREDITHKSLDMLVNYVDFLKEEKTLNENLDLFLPLYTRVMLWSIYKNIHSCGISYKNIMTILKEYKDHKAFKDIVKMKGNLKYFKHLPGTIERLFLKVSLFLHKHGLNWGIAVLFIVCYPVMWVYIRKKIKS